MTSDSSTGAQARPSPEALLGAWTGSAAFVYCRDLSGKICAANEAFARKFGRPVEQLMGKPVAGMVHLDDNKSFVRADSGVQRNPHNATTHEQRWLTPQGWRWIDWEESAVFDLHGTIIAVRAVGHDITRRRLAEEQFLKLSNAVEQSPIATVITDAEGRVQYVNGKFSSTSGLTLETILDREIDVLREGHPTEEAYREFRTKVSGGQEWRGELNRQGPQGAVWESVRVCPLRNPQGEISNLLLLREDITERKTLEGQLRQVQKMEGIGTLAGGIAHDFNNILAVINGYAELCVLNAGDTAIVQKSVREIKRAAERATGLVRQILTFSRKAEVRVAPLDLNQHLKDLVALLAETFPRNITFQFALDDALPPLLADQNQLQQIVLNLCVNARDAMPSGGTITLSTQRLEGDAVPISMPSRHPCAAFKVTDTGTGMPAHVRERIFEPFFTTKGVNKGTGLGLAVVYGIVASHEGCIDVDSVVGQGTTFRVCLPFSEAAIQAPIAARPAEFPGGTESMLIVDDEAALRQLLETSFSRKGYNVTTASDGLEAIDILGRGDRKFDIVLLDLNMPGATGIEVLKVLKITQPHVKVLVLTGHLSPEVKAEFEQMGHDNFVRKPYKLDEVGRKVRSVLAG